MAVTVYISEEMRELFSIFIPWVIFDDERSFKEGTPQEAIEAREKYEILFDEQYQLALNNILKDSGSNK